MTFSIKQQAILRRAMLVVVFFAAILATTNLMMRLSTIANASTSAFCLLVIVLLSAFIGDIYVAIITSVIATLCFDYFCLPPFGTFTIAAFPDVISLIAFLVASTIISRLTASAAENATKARDLDQALAGVKEFGAWLLSMPNDQITLSRMAEDVLRIFSLEYCAIHVYGDGKWYHVTGAARQDISQSVEQRSLKVLRDHPTDLIELADEQMLGIRYAQVNVGSTPHALLVVKSSSLPSNVISVIAGMIGLRILNIKNG